jgi:hypothetical protein
VHGLVDHGNSAGPRVHYGQWPWDDRGSSHKGRSAAPVDGSLLQRREKGEWNNTVLTKGFSDQRRGGVELAVMDNGGGGSHSTTKRRGNGKVEPELGVDVGQRWCSRAPFIGPRRERSGRDVKGNGGRQWVN